MIFEKKYLRIVVPLDPVEGACYTKPVHDEDSDVELDCIYQITAQDQDQANSTMDGIISWDHDSSCMLDSEEEIERWQNQLHEVMTLNCNRMVRSLLHVIIEARERPIGEVTMKVKEPVD